ncbi:MAG: carboxylating nicotinate-nucleotide diphosphorylase [Fuerstiella sp.]|nr:carboxylating nicotinate-nucleotide diphosphorylase [Fuerstiella sp.]MCP4509215.1 carboxylating nicotinate-nucleotide diphosphorylase [Fuerstiella sp.]
MTTVDISTAALASADKLIHLALAEDLEDRGDLTCQATVPSNATAVVKLVARENGVLGGTVLIKRVYAALCERQQIPADTIQVTSHVSDGERVEPGTPVATVAGPVSLLLTGERVVLNFVIHLSGVASMTARFVQRIHGSRAVILDTRKTLPGFRLLHKYAVRCGGGSNHRMGLFDGMLIKDNHLAARGSGSVADAVATARAWLQIQALDLPVEVEVDTLDQLRDALAEQPEIVLLDNMKPAQLQTAVMLRDKRSPRTLLEASGGVNLETVGCIAGTGVDRISVGALTHSAPSLDFGYDWLW